MRAWTVPADTGARGAACGRTSSLRSIHRAPLKTVAHSSSPPAIRLPRYTRNVRTVPGPRGCSRAPSHTKRASAPSHTKLAIAQAMMSFRSTVRPQRGPEGCTGESRTCGGPAVRVMRWTTACRARKPLNTRAIPPPCLPGRPLWTSPCATGSVVTESSSRPPDWLDWPKPSGPTAPLSSFQRKGPVFIGCYPILR